jgi:hypothetical protein
MESLKKHCSITRFDPNRFWFDLHVNFIFDPLPIVKQATELNHSDTHHLLSVSFLFLLL